MGFMTGLKWSGTFNNDKAQLDQLCAEMERIVNDICEKFDEAKSYWIDDGDARGKKFKDDSVNMLESIKRGITVAKITTTKLCDDLDKSLTNINDDNY